MSPRCAPCIQMKRIQPSFHSGYSQKNLSCSGDWRLLEPRSFRCVPDQHFYCHVLHSAQNLINKVFRTPIAHITPPPAVLYQVNTLGTVPRLHIHTVCLRLLRTCHTQVRSGSCSGILPQDTIRRSCYILHNCLLFFSLFRSSISLLLSQAIPEVQNPI